MYVVIYFIFIPIVLSFGQHNSQAQPDIIKRCINSTNSTSCSLTYEQVYQNLSKSENNFNISNALYPGRSKPSSLHVLVNVYGPYKTKDSVPAQYAWSVSCLYAAVPASVLGFLSLGSILVSRRTQHLDLHIPLFCCNVSESKEEREEKIKGFLTRVLGELQDLAVGPGIRDPKLNTAKCITEGHEPSMDAAGLYLRICVLWLSLGFVLVSSPLLSRYVVGLENEVNPKQKHTQLLEGENKMAAKKSLEERKKENIFKALCILCRVLSVLSGILFILALAFSIHHCKNLKESFDIPLILILIILYSFSLPFILKYFDCDLSIWACGENYFFFPFVVTSTIVISYHFCWLMTGIMLNPTWGLTVALLASVILVAFMYAVYLYVSRVRGRGKLQPFLFSGAGFLAVLFLVVIVLFAGQSYNSNETADEVLKISLLYFIGAFVSWISWKKEASQVSSNGTNAERRDANRASSDGRSAETSFNESPLPTSKIRTQ